ncbi:ATP-binding cassette domain-containing protein [Streptomyces tremellae]|uniref:ABC transporter domain-containing protein n=1 Tax=Streptomyces tremellae TaxID=1124239 RepID=A0ABP7G438_9ACTN
MRILSTLLCADAGRARVAGRDVAADPHGVRERLGLSAPYAAVDEKPTGRENLYLVARLYGMSRRAARRGAAELLADFRLQEAADRPSGTFSGAMRRLLDLAGALVAKPPVAVLDEPTTGLDPRGRTGAWSAVRELVAAGTTVLLTTQYLEEAGQLADSIAVIDRGRVIARGSATDLKARVGGERLALTLADPRPARPRPRHPCVPRPAHPRLRPARRPLHRRRAGAAADGRRVEPGLRHGDHDPRPLRQPGADPGHSWPVAHALPYAVTCANAITALFMLLAGARYRRVTRG